MTNRFLICCILLLLTPALAAAQSTPDPARELLSLESAIRLAIDNNRSLETAKLQAKKAEEDLAVARMRRLPSFETTVLASQLVTPVSFSFPQGSFGNYPGTGPIPAVDTEITSPRRPSVFATAQVSQPLSQLVRIGLNIKGATATRDLERERTRKAELATINNVKRLYFAIQQSESALAVTEEAIALYRELDRTLQVRVTQRVALRSDALDVQFKLAKEELNKTTSLNTLASQKEQLNQLLGRDVRTSFATEAIAPVVPVEIDLDAIQSRALESRPDVKEARIKADQAEIDRRAKRAENIPEVSLAFSYNSNFNIDVLPKNLATVGVQVKWEPFDWGRKGREVAAKAHVVEQARLAVRDAEDKAVLEINNYFRKLTEARAILNVAQMAQSAAREKLRVKTNQYQIQAALLSDVLHLRADLADTNDQYQQALLAFWTAKADFELAAGEEVIR